MTVSLVGRIAMGSASSDWPDFVTHATCQQYTTIRRIFESKTKIKIRKKDACNIGKKDRSNHFTRLEPGKVIAYIFDSECFCSELSQLAYLITLAYFNISLEYLWGEIFNMFLLLFQRSRRDKHGKVAVFEAMLFDGMVEPLLDLLPDRE